MGSPEPLHNHSEEHDREYRDDRKSSTLRRPFTANERFVRVLSDCKIPINDRRRLFMKLHFPSFFGAYDSKNRAAPGLCCGKKDECDGAGRLSPTPIRSFHFRYSVGHRLASTAWSSFTTT